MKIPPKKSISILLVFYSIICLFEQDHMAKRVQIQNMQARYGSPSLGLSGQVQGIAGDYFFFFLSITALFYFFKV